MIVTTPRVLAIFLLLLSAPLLAKDFYGNYEDGLKAAKSGNWSAVADKMTQAIKQNPTENKKFRPYGTLFVSYHPYYYRGVAHFNLGRFNEALADLKRATGVGELDLGSVDSFRDRAEAKLQDSRPPPPVNPPTNTNPPTSTGGQFPSPPTQTSPSIDPLLGPARSSSERAIANATAKLREAQRADAELLAASQFDQARKLLSDANARSASAGRTADFRTVTDLAERASRGFDAAILAAQSAGRKTLPSNATDAILSGTKERLRRAVELYFDGDFDAAAVAFDRLSGDLRTNPMVWAFLGASRYYSYYLDGGSDPAARKRAEDAFKRARKLRPNLTLSERYFSQRVRRFYNGLR